MDCNLSNICALADRMAELKAQMETLKQEQAELEAVFLKRAEDDLRDTKLKTVSYLGKRGGKVTATMAQSLKITYPSYLKKILGCAYAESVTTDVKYKVSAPTGRMFIGLWTGEYLKMSMSQLIAEMPCDDTTKKVLHKKLKGVRYETDLKNLMDIGKFEEHDASDYAYLLHEAAVWENFMRLMKANGTENEDAIRNALELIAGAVVVEETPKITVEAT